VVGNARRQIGRRHAERRRKIKGGAAAEAVTAAGKSLIVPMLIRRLGFAVMVRTLLRAGLGVSDVKMKRGMSVSAHESQRQ
jgi:hypothetical protein